MTVMADHRKTAPGKSSAKVPAWTVLVTMGGTSIILNFWDATHTPHPLFLLIAALRGFAPVAAAMGLSEAAARFDGGKTFRIVAFAIMTGAMLLSASAVANVLRPSYPAGLLGLGLAWLFGIVLDAAAITCLWIILTERERRREAERAEEARDAAGEMAEAVAAAAARAADMAAAERAQIEAQAAEERAALETELASVSAELTAANVTVEALRTAARGPRKRSQPAAPRASKNASQSDSEEDLTLELRAVQMLTAHPELKKPRMGSELGRRLGVHESTGRRLHSSLTGEQLPGEALAGQPENRSGESAQDRSDRGDGHTDERS